jgi:hypothetical protein
MGKGKEVPMSMRDTNSSGLEMDRGILDMIREDMHVYDVDNHHIGDVEDIYLGQESDAATAQDPSIRDHDSIIDWVAEAFDSDNIPEVLRNRLLHEGFIRMDSDGIFSSDRYILPEQIAGVSGDKVLLNVRKADLIKR